MPNDYYTVEHDKGQMTKFIGFSEFGNFYSNTTTSFFRQLLNEISDAEELNGNPLRSALAMEHMDGPFRAFAAKWISMSKTWAYQR